VPRSEINNLVVLFVVMPSAGATRVSDGHFRGFARALSP